MKQPKTTEEWMEIFEACDLSGLSIRRWCKENQFSENAYRYWYDKLLKRNNEILSTPTFAPITVPSQLNQTQAEPYPFRI